MPEITDLALQRKPKLKSIKSLKISEEVLKKKVRELLKNCCQSLIFQ